MIVVSSIAVIALGDLLNDVMISDNTFIGYLWTVIIQLPLTVILSGSAEKLL